jgi:hypothetical protein
MYLTHTCPNCGKHHESQYTPEPDRLCPDCEWLFEQDKLKIATKEKAVRDSLVNNLKNKAEIIMEAISVPLQELEDLKSPSLTDTHKKKKEFLLELLYHLPLERQFCAYCINKDKTDTECCDCDYGITKGVCSEPDSVYNRISSKIVDLIAEVENNY